MRIGTGGRPTSRGAVVALWLVVLTLLGACSAQSISGVSDAPPTEPPSSAPTGDAPSVSPSEPAVTDAPTDAPTDGPASGPPDKPTGTTFTLQGEQPGTGGSVRQTYQVGWKAPAGVATTFLIYGVKDCLRASKANNHKPCIVRGMPIPRSQLDLLAQAPEPLRQTQISWVVPRSGKLPYAGVLIRASNDQGDSIFTIVHSEDVCWRC